MNTDVEPMDFPPTASIPDPTTTAPNRELVLDVPAHDTEEAAVDEPLIRWHQDTSPLLATGDDDHHRRRRRGGGREADGDDDAASSGDDEVDEPFPPLPKPATALVVAHDDAEGRVKSDPSIAIDTPTTTPNMAGSTPTSAVKPTRHQISVRSQPRHVFVVDAARVSHLPPPMPTTAGASCPPSRGGGAAALAPPVPLTPHVLCEHFDVKNPTLARCPRGSRCPFVHADVRGAPRYSPHTIDGGLAGLFEGYRPSQVGASTVRVILPPASMLVSVDATSTNNDDDGSSRPTPVATTPVAARATPPAGAMASAASSPRSLPPQSPRPTTSLVACSHSSEGFDAPLACLLRTRALQYPPPDADVHPAMPTVTQCAHFAAKRKCDRGVRCKFAHVLPRPPATPQPQQPQHQSASAGAASFGLSHSGSGLLAASRGGLSASASAARAAQHLREQQQQQQRPAPVQGPTVQVEAAAPQRSRGSPVVAAAGSACASAGDSSRRSVQDQRQLLQYEAAHTQVAHRAAATPGLWEYSNSLPIPAAGGGASLSWSRWTAGTPLGASVGSVHAASVWRRDPYAASPRSLDASNATQLSLRSWEASARRHSAHHGHHHHHPQHHHHHPPPPAAHHHPSQMDASTISTLGNHWQGQHWVPVPQSDPAAPS